MSAKRYLIRFVLILVVAGVAYWQQGKDLPFSPTERAESPTASSSSGSASGASATKTKESAPSTIHGYDVFREARLVEDKGNDGDSFAVRAGDREFVLRLYFVDTPESYLNDRYESQRRRVADQARDLGGISSEEAVAVGKAAKKFTLEELGKKPFTVYTYWEEVYDGDRFYGFVELADGSDLASRLVEEGLARIHTKGPGSKANPVPTPQGDSFFQARDKLESIERRAQRAKRGVWGL